LVTRARFIAFELPILFFADGGLLIPLSDEGEVWASTPKAHSISRVRILPVWIDVEIRDV
jgi:hypothetical protein